MRITGGKFKGQKLLVYNDKKILRPSFSKLREALFNIIEVEDKKFLDLFAGVGTIGIEALSRGAEFISFVERDFKVLSFLYKNLKLLNISRSSYYIYKSDVFRFLKRSNLSQYDYIFLDPPYSISADYLNNLIDIFFNENLKKTCILILQFSLKKKEKIYLRLKDYIFKYKEYGDSFLMFWSISK